MSGDFGLPEPRTDEPRTDGPRTDGRAGGASGSLPPSPSPPGGLRRSRLLLAGLVLFVLLGAGAVTALVVRARPVG
ncbi:MAG: hypothetical protein M3Y71_02055, partial [Actinomycetota bacterium]|nr:hypothetical protein [Actinomycetota bacterium]